MDWKADTPTGSPLVARFLDDGDRLTTVTIFYDDNTRKIDAIGHMARHYGCSWATFVVAGRPVFAIPEGANEFDASMLGVSTIDELNAAGFTAGR